MADPWIVLTFLGDYPVDGQECWKVEFTNRKAAIKAAKEQHEKYNDSEYYTVVGRENSIGEKVSWIMYQQTILTSWEAATDLANKLGGGL